MAVNSLDDLMRLWGADKGGKVSDNPKLFDVPPHLRGGTNLEPYQSEITLRDLFAGMCAAVCVDPPFSPATMARNAYALADALLAERAKRQ